jgi:Peptidase family C25
LLDAMADLDEDGRVGEKLVANGIDPDTGGSLAQVDVEELAALLSGRSLDQADQRMLQRHSDTSPTFGLPPQVTPTEIASAGWGVVFSTDADDSLRRALQPLIEHRRSQVPDAARFHVLDYAPGEKFRSWLNRHGAVAGSPDPARVPYYLLIVGSPASIPFEFQYLLDVDYAVGRIAFDEIDDYRRYSESVVAFETAAPSADVPRALFFGTAHSGDAATRLSSERLMQPLVKGHHDQQPVVERCGGIASSLLGSDATRANFVDAISGANGGLSLLFTASHGLGGLRPDDTRQRDLHGALVCQDWLGGPVDAATQAVTSDALVGARIHGLVAFLFACFGGGTPELDEFPQIVGEPRPRIANEPFVAALPQAMLAHKAGGALAVIAHVDRAWSYSIDSDGVSQLLTFENLLSSALLGEPLGHAMRFFNDKYAALSTDLASLQREIDDGLGVTPIELARVWVERTDAQNIVLLGDPAVRIPVPS